MSSRGAVRPLPALDDLNDHYESRQSRDNSGCTPKSPSHQRREEPKRPVGLEDEDGDGGYYFCYAGSSWSCGFSVAPSGLSYYSETVAPKWLPLQRRCERINDLALRTCSLVWGRKNWQGDKKLLAGTTFKCVNIIVSSSTWPLGQQTDITTQSISFHTKQT